MIQRFLKAARRIVYVRITSDRVIMESNDGLRWEAHPDIGIKRVGTDEVIAVIKDGSGAYAKHSEVTRWVNPFAHPRTILANFNEAEKLLQHGLHTMMPGFLTASPALAIMHPLEKLEGGLTGIEAKALRELALGAGFRDVKVYTGEELLVQGMTLKNLHRRVNPGQEAVSTL